MHAQERQAGSRFPSPPVANVVLPGPMASNPLLSSVRLLVPHGRQAAAMSPGRRGDNELTLSRLCYAQS